MLDVAIIETSGLGGRSYLISDGEVAVAIDPQRDIDRCSSWRETCATSDTAKILSQLGETSDHVS